MKTVWLLFAVILVAGVVGCSKPGVRTVSKVKKTTLLYYIKPGTKIGDVAINPKDGAKMVWVPNGEFLMGSEERAGYTHQHKVYLDGYWMYKYEVTVVQYRKFCSETGKQMPKAPEWGWGDNHPIVCVAWQDAVDYAKWAGASLPTEAQWEKAARGTDGREYPWGNQWDALKCNEGSKGPKQTQPVGSYDAGASPYGSMDMAGNVFEWCGDWYAADYYKSGPSRNPTGPTDGSCRVLRGGGWYSDAYDYRCASRNDNYPSLSLNLIGFRLTR